VLDAPELEVFPKHFTLRPGEQIHYNVVERSRDGQSRTVDYEFTIENHQIVRPIEKWVLEAARPGRTELLVRTPSSERRVTLEVAGHALPSLAAVPHSSVQEIVATELLFVGHANLDGFDLTAVAKPGIDRLVREAKKNRVPVVYWVSREYPNWYTADREPDYAIISEGQEHQIRVDARRVTFTGGHYMFCLLRNAQMTLHGMVKHAVAQRIHFVFPAEAIWSSDWPSDKRGYPAPATLLSTVFARRRSDARAYDEVVVPFLDRLTKGLPLGGYLPDFPAPVMTDVLEEWSVVVRFGERFERVYRPGDPNKTLLIEFRGV
jgi:hypothetical protein